MVEGKTKDSETTTDTAGDGIAVKSARWTFGGNVANHFDSPMYQNPSRFIKVDMI